MSLQDYAPETRKHVKYYWGLALALALVAVVAVLYAAAGGPSLGVFSQQATFAALGVFGAGVVIIVILFLLRIGSIFELQRSMQNLYDGAEDRAAEANAKLIAGWDQFRDDLRKDLLDLKQEWRTEKGIQDRNIDDVANAARAAMKAVKDLETRVGGMGRDPSQAIAIEKLNEQVSGLSKSVLELKQRDNINSPLLKELQEAVSLLTKNQTKLIQRIDTTIEAMERREMEGASLRANAERELGDVKRREALLAVKTRELEDLNEHLAVEAKRAAAPMVSLKASEAKQHVIMVEGIGPAYASRLNQVGIITVPQLLQANPDVIGPKVEATPELVREWQSMAELMRLKGVGPQYAELLVKGGVRSIAHLAASDPDDLSRKLGDVERGRKIRIQSGPVTPGIVKRWIDAAKTGEFDAN